MSNFLFPDHLLFQEENFLKLTKLCQELYKFVEIQRNNSDKIKETVRQCQEIGISDKFNLVLTEICEKSSCGKSFSDCISPDKKQQHSDSEYENLMQLYVKGQNELETMKQKIENFQEQINDLQWVNKEQIKKIEYFKREQAEQRLAMSQISLPKNVFGEQSIFSEDNTGILVSSQNQINSTVDLSQYSSITSLSETSKMVRKSITISLQTSVLQHFKLIYIENKIQEYILVYRKHQLRLEKKEQNRMEKILARQEKIRQQKQKSMDDKQKQLLEQQKIINESLNLYRQINLQKEEFERKKNEEENRIKQEILNRKTELENNKLKELLDKENNRVNELLTKHKNKLGL